jgi:hypothetical protein
VQAVAITGALFCRKQLRGEFGRQAFNRPDVLHPPVAGVGHVFCEVGDDLEEWMKFFRFTVAQIVGREQVEGRDRDAEVVAPLEELVVLRCARTVTVRRRLELTKPRPPAITVNDHRDMFGKGLAGE